MFKRLRPSRLYAYRIEVEYLRISHDVGTSRHKKNTCRFLGRVSTLDPLVPAESPFVCSSNERLLIRLIQTMNRFQVLAGMVGRI